VEVSGSVLMAVAGSEEDELHAAAAAAEADCDHAAAAVRFALDALGAPLYRPVWIYLAFP
jgi:hypothetical protein